MTRLYKPKTFDYATFDYQRRLRDIGMFFQTLEFQTAFAGELYGIDAFDQPGVELAKKFTNGLMGKKGFEEYAKKVSQV